MINKREERIGERIKKLDRKIIDDPDPSHASIHLRIRSTLAPTNTTVIIIIHSSLPPAHGAAFEICYWEQLSSIPEKKNSL